jgi:hypothetical protein
MQPLKALRLDPHITDDLGRDHALPVSVWRTGDHPSPRIAFIQREAAGIAMGTGVSFGRMMLWACLTTVPVVVLIVSLPSMGVPVPPWLLRHSSMFALLIGSVWGIALRRAYFRQHKHRLITLMTRNGLCAACGFETVGAPVDASGMLRCTECAAAWRASRFPSASVAGPGAAPRGDPAVRSLVASFTGPRRTRPIADHRSNPAALLSRTPREAARPDDDASCVMRRREAERDIRIARRTDRWIAVPLIAMFGCAMAIFLGRPAASAPSFPVALMPLALAIGALVFTAGITWNLWAGRMTQPPAHLDETMAAFALCPACAEDLAPVAPEADGCRVCPVCAGAWRIAIPVESEHTPDAPLLTRDDAGRPVMLDRASWARSPAYTSPTIHRMLRTSALGVSPTGGSVMRGFAIGAVSAVPVALLATALGAGPEWALIAGFCAALVVIPLYITLADATPARFHPATFTMRAKRAGVCPACGYSLLGLDVPDSGLVPCPECGAAWRFDAATGKAPAVSTTTITPPG